MRKVAFVQTNLPHYRLSFLRVFDKRLQDSSFRLYIHARKLKLPFGSDFVSVKFVGLTFLLIGIIFGRFNLIILEGGHRVLLTYVLLFLSRIKGIEVASFSHLFGKRSYNLLAFSSKKFLRYFFLRLFSHNIFYTQHEACLAASLFRDLPPNRFYSIDNSSVELADKYLVKAYIPAQRSIDILVVGRLTTKLELDLLLKALSQTSISFPITVVIVGSTSRDTVYIRSNTCVNTVDFVPFVSNPIVLSDYYNNAKLFLYPGDIGLSVVPPIFYGLPVVIHSSFNHHMPEPSLFHSSAVSPFIFFNRSDPNSLASVLDYSLESDATLISYAKSSSSLATDYTYENMSERLLAMFHQVLSFT